MSLALILCGVFFGLASLPGSLFTFFGAMVLKGKDQEQAIVVSAVFFLVFCASVTAIVAGCLL